MKEMTSLERCMAVLNGNMPDKLPVVPQCFMLAVETAGMKISDVNKNGRKMAEAHFISQEKYGYDGCVIDFNDATIAEAVGAKVIFRDDEPAIVDESEPVLKDLRDVYDLSIPDPFTSGRLNEWLEATRVLKEKIGDHVFIMGRADQGPFSIACLLRGTTQFMMDLMTEDRQLIQDVLDYCRKVSAVFAKAQKDAGAYWRCFGWTESDFAGNVSRLCLGTRETSGRRSSGLRNPVLHSYMWKYQWYYQRYGNDRSKNPGSGLDA